MSFQPHPLVSVIIPTYNRAQMLSDAIKSVLSQTYQNFELLVIDDHSTDNTTTIVKEFHDNRIYYFQLSKNLGAPAARNHGLEKAKGDYITFLDSDDQWLPGKLEKQIGLLEKKKNVGLVCTGVKVMNNHFEWLNIPKYRGDMSNLLLVKNYVGTTSSVMIKKELIEFAGGFDLTFKSCQDWDLFIRLSQLCEFDYIREPLVLYFEHNEKRISTNPVSVINGHFKIRAKHRKIIALLPQKLLLQHYVYLAKIIIKAGILLLDKNFSNHSRLLKSKFL